MSDVDTKTEAVERLADFVGKSSLLAGHARAANMLRALAAERDALAVDRDACKRNMEAAAELAARYGAERDAARVAEARADGAEAMRNQIAEWIGKVRDYCISQRDAAENKAAEDLFEALARDRKGILDGIALMPLPAAILAAIEKEPTT